MIILPTWPGARRAVPRVLDFGGIQEPQSGAETQRLNKLGNRYGVAFVMPPLRATADEGMKWVNRLIRGQQAGARMEYPLLDFDPGTPGTFRVNGSGQAGKMLAIKGGAPFYTFREGQPFHLSIGGQLYLDFIGADTTADGSGNATITLSQMLRKPPIDNDPLEFAQPCIEGWVVGDQLSWELALERNIGLTFEIHERR